MAQADDVDLVAPGVSIWHAYDRASRTELFASAITTSSGTYVVDPIGLADDACEGLGDVTAIIVTNANHERASAEFASDFNVPVFKRGDQLPAEVTVTMIDGGAPDEIAVCIDRTLVLGDSLINFEPYGFTFLPAKYCTEPKLLRASLRQLLDLTFDRIVFAHGMPITSRAHARLTELLNA